MNVPPKVLAIVALAAGAWLVAPTGASAVTVTYDTPGTYDWVVPADVASATFGVYGARGGASGSSIGGAGGGVVATLALTPGETLQIKVGGAGADAPVVVGGQNGGGLAGSETCVGSSASCRGGGGGGASDVRRGGTALSDRVLVGGAGGGAGGRSTDACSGACASPREGGNGGAGGGLVAGMGLWGGGSDAVPAGGGCSGGGGDQFEGGARGDNGGGALSCNGPSGNVTSGASGLGGNGGDSAGGGGSGGGGGGGYYGGGGGSGGFSNSGGGGGGGGSNFATPAATGVTMSQGSNIGEGLVTITYGEAPSTPEITASDPPSPANDNDPKLLGTADPGTTVRIYTTSGCSGSPVASGTEEAFTTTGIGVNVADNTTTAFRATAAAGASVSGCSAPFTYTERTLPGGGVPPDRTAPVVALGGKKSQKLGKRVTVAATAESEACTVAATGKVKIPGKDPKLGPASLSIALGATESLRLTVSRKAREAIEAALDDGAKPTAFIEVVARDPAGNESSLRRRVRLKG